MRLIPAANLPALGPVARYGPVGLLVARHPHPGNTRVRALRRPPYNHPTAPRAYRLAMNPPNNPDPDTTTPDTPGATRAPEGGEPAPRTRHTAEALAGALAAHPTRAAAAASLGMDPSSFRRTARRLGVPWPTGDRAPGSAGGKWSAENRTASVKEWARRKRAMLKARAVKP